MLQLSLIKIFLMFSKVVIKLWKNSTKSNGIKSSLFSFFFYWIRIPTYSVLQSNRIVPLSKPSVFFIPCRLQHRAMHARPFYLSHLWFLCRRQRWCFWKLITTGSLVLGIDFSHEELIPPWNWFFLYENLQVMYTEKEREAHVLDKKYILA
jgi:hypothetical protein